MWHICRGVPYKISLYFLWRHFSKNMFCVLFTAQKMKVFLKNFFRKYEKITSFQKRRWRNLFTKKYKKFLRTYFFVQWLLGLSSLYKMKCTQVRLEILKLRQKCLHVMMSSWSWSFQYGLVSCINHDFRSFFHIFVGFLCKIIQLLTLPNNIIMSVQRRIYNLLERPLIINYLTSIDMYNF